ncbi:MAG TPA: S1 RNA-binding domain-containing protein [bacterium]|nr:S1 RNA-binding domain-containing protein [bacterium]
MASQATLDRLCAEFDSPAEHIATAVALLEQNATPAYLARYRRHELGNMTEDRLVAVAERLHHLSELEQRRATILQQADERGRRTEELERALTATADQDLLDDYYQSMRPRRRGLAMQMEEKGLMPLALAILHRQFGDAAIETVPSSGEPEGAAESPAAAAVPDVDLRKLAEPYISEENGIPSAESALEGALLILSDRIVHEPTTRARFRDELRRGILRARPVDPDGDPGKYKQFFDFAEPINRIPSGRMLALRRAEREKILKLELGLPPGRHRELLRELHAKDTVPGTQLGDFYDLVFDNAAVGLQELCGNDVRRRLKEKADREAMRTYGRNLRSQLLAPPLGEKKVLALRTSGKAIWAALLNEDGSVAQHKTLPTDNDEQKQGAIGLLVEIIREHQPHAIAVPHGRRQASSEKVVAQLREALGDTPAPMVVPVDEAASTIFAASTGGKKAIPGVEVGVRTAISLGRRLQDPLLELLRMDIRTLGLGHTLDDVHQGTLQRELGRVKSSCLAEIGCDLNTAGADVLQSVPGLGSERAQALVKHRKEIGGFKTRAQILAVESINETCYRNIAGFVRISGGDEPLDATPLHPDDYDLVRAIAQLAGSEPLELVGKHLRHLDADELASEQWTKERVQAVLQQLRRAGKDPRGELMAAANEGVHTLADLHQDRELKGRIASLTEFGAFVDLGIGHDGLVHISQIPGQRLRDPNQMLRVGEVVTVWVLNVDQQKKKISLSMHKPRHLAEGRLPTLGERMEQQQGRRRGRGPRESQEGRRPGSAGGRPGGGRRRGGPGQQGEREGGGRFGGGRGPRDRGPRRGGRGDGPREQRVYTVEPAREISEQRTKKGELTSLSNLRNLLGRSGDDQGDKQD